MESELSFTLAQHDQFMARADEMLAAGANGGDLPEAAKFHEHELASLDNQSTLLVIERRGSRPPEQEWSPPAMAAYKGWKGSTDRFEWLRKYRAELQRSKHYLELLKAG